MATSLTSTGITFPDATTQTTAAAGYAGPGGKQVFTTSGTFSVPSGVTKVKATVIGAGGNGGSANIYVAGGGGGAGGYIVDYVSVNSGASCTVTVGTNSGTRTSSFVGNSTLTASGGSNGGSASGYDAGAAGLSGSASVFGVTYYSAGSTRYTDNSYSQDGYVVLSGTTRTPNGGVYNHGYGAAGSGRDTSSGWASRYIAVGYGGGGGGGSTNATGGGTGVNGLVIVEW